MSTAALSGNDTIKINGRILADLADGDVMAITFPNDVAAMKTGKNGNTVYALNETGRQSEAVLRIIRGSADDKFMNQILVSQQADFAGFPLINGEFGKRIGDGLGNVLNDTYLMSGGIIQKQVEAKSNVEGETEQSVSIWHLKFANNPRTLG